LICREWIRTHSTDFPYHENMRVALVNPNRIKPPISPLGLEYVTKALLAAGHH
jgi:hypothetical protein